MQKFFSCFFSAERAKIISLLYMITKFQRIKKTGNFSTGVRNVLAEADISLPCDLSGGIWMTYSGLPNY